VNILNRIVTILLVLVLLALALVLAVFPVQALTTAQRGLEAVDAFFLVLESSYFWLFVAARVLLVLLAVFIAGLLFWGELRPKQPRSVRIHTEAGSIAEVTAESVARRLAWHIDQLADVISVSPQVRPRGRAVDVRLDLRTSPEIDVPMKTDEVVALAHEVIAERMGLQPGKIEVHIDHAPYTDGA
jgi:hypothetical protein